MIGIKCSLLYLQRPSLNLIVRRRHYSFVMSRMLTGRQRL